MRRVLQGEVRIELLRANALDANQSKGRVRIKDSNGDASPPRHYQGRQTMGGHTLFLRYEKKIAQVKHLRYRCLCQFHYQLIRGHCNLLPISKEIV